MRGADVISVRDKLVAAGTAVRSALEHPYIDWGGFPLGWCQGSSKILAKFLVEAVGLTPIEGVANGARRLAEDDPDEMPFGQSHFWLEHAGYVIDITADQFDDCTAPVIVTSNKTWHDQFRGQTRLSQEVATDLNDYLQEKYADVLFLLKVPFHRTRRNDRLFIETRPLALPRS